MEGRNIPDYTATDDFQVTLRIESKIVDSHLRKYLAVLQASREPSKRLNVFDLITIYSNLRKNGNNIYERSLNRQLDEGIIKHPVYGYIMGNGYFEYHRFVIGDTMWRLYYVLEPPFTMLLPRHS